MVGLRPDGVTSGDITDIVGVEGVRYRFRNVLDDLGNAHKADGFFSQYHYCGDFPYAWSASGFGDEEWFGCYRWVFLCEPRGRYRDMIFNLAVPVQATIGDYRFHNSQGRVDMLARRFERLLPSV